MSQRIKLAAVGDISFGNFPLTIGFGVRSSFEHNEVNSVNDSVRHVLQSVDLCFGNLETVISDIGYKPWALQSAQMRGNPNMSQFLTNSGIDVVSVANNHMMQHGSRAFEETISLLQVAKISPVGVNDSVGKNIPYRRIINGQSVCFLGYSMRPEKYNRYPLYSRGTREGILSDIAQYKESCDYLILSLHWGDEFVEFPSPVQVQIGHEFIDAGAKVILGHHPHIVQGVERYHGGVIAYSLGNFVFDFWQNRLRESMILIISLDDGVVEKFEIVPVRINKNYEPEVLSGGEAVSLMEKQQKICGHPVFKQDVGNGCALFDLGKYKRQVRMRLLENKIQSRFFFMRNLYKYPRGIAWQSAMGFVSSRMEKKKCDESC